MLIKKRIILNYITLLSKIKHRSNTLLLNYNKIITILNNDYGNFKDININYYQK